VIRVAVAAALLLASTPSYADDDKFDSLTLLPWSDASFVITESDHRAVVQYSQLAHDGLGIHASVSAPIDDSTRTAAFTINNKLASGFKASLQIGRDTRAEHLAALESATRVVADAVKKLAIIRQYTTAQLAYQRDNKLSSLSTGDIYKAECKKLAGGTDATCTVAARATLVPKLCAAFGRACATEKDFDELATDYWGAYCLVPTVPPERHEACAVAGPLRDELSLQPLAEQFLSIINDPNLVVEIWNVYSYLAPDAAKECPTRAAQCILDHATAVADAISTFITTAPLARRDLLMFAIQDHWGYALLGSVSTSYDRASVYQESIANQPETDTTYDLQVGLDGTLYTSQRGLSVNLRVGYERSRGIGAQPVQRCEVTDGSNATVSGSSCDPNALFRSGVQPGATSSLYVRAAVDYQFSTTLQQDTVVPGVEGRLGLDNIGSGAVMSARASLFAMPVKGTTAARIGVALDLQHPVDEVAGTPNWVVTPLVFIGATFSDLMTN
jgi:hypothetical protein